MPGTSSHARVYINLIKTNMISPSSLEMYRKQSPKITFSVMRDLIVPLKAARHIFHHVRLTAQRVEIPLISSELPLKFQSTDINNSLQMYCRACNSNSE